MMKYYELMPVCIIILLFIITITILVSTITIQHTCNSYALWFYIIMFSYYLWDDWQ